LDLAFNQIKKIENIPKAKIEKLYLNENKIHQIENLNHLKDLKLLELGSNKIKKIENLQENLNLEQLWIGRNKIRKIENLNSLIQLKTLSIQDNLLTKIDQLNDLINLRELYLSENGIQTIENLEKLNLQTLDLSENKISKIENVKHFQELEEFWVFKRFTKNHQCSSNLIEKISDLQELSECKSLTSVYFERNPMSKDVQYKRKLQLQILSLEEIDGSPIQKFK
jgi:protein phosphatase 1 regulatory subunit 7